MDFFDVVVAERGQQRHAWKFLMHLMYSGYDFVWLYDRCDQLAFLDAHVRAFAYFGGVPQRLAYDNLTPIPSGDTLKAIAEATLTEVESASRTKGATPGQTVWERFQEERPHFRALPSVAFDARHTQSLLVNHRAIVQIEGAKYSVPSTWVGRTITAAIGVEEICRDRCR